ncbi:hypothetical protein [Fodinicola feengrottensis]|uniref:hypothetical protein n=1 Tax=Fodinicola feengrottensis TaxID=435914 RepID=UPI002440EEFD|nr:hypothetical protein [Fodinicola feengrottensis]
MNARTPAVSEQDLNHPSSLSAFRTVKLLVGGYLGLSVLTMVAVILLRDDTSVVTDAVWVRASIVTLSALLTLAFSFSAARGGSRRGFPPAPARLGDHAGRHRGHRGATRRLPGVAAGRAGRLRAAAGRRGRTGQRPAPAVVVRHSVIHVP